MPVGVQHVGAQLRRQAPEFAALLEVGPGREQHPMDGHARRGQRRLEPFGDRRLIRHQRDMHRVLAAAQPDAQGLHHALQPTDADRGHGMQHAQQP